MNPFLGLPPQVLINVIYRTQRPRIGADTTDFAKQATDLWNTGMNMLTDAVNLPSYALVKGVKVITGGFSSAAAEAMGTGSTAAAQAIEAMGTSYGDTAKKVLTDLGVGVGAAAAGVGQGVGQGVRGYGAGLGDAADDLLWPILLGAGVLVLGFGGVVYLLTSGGGQAVLTGVGKAVPAMVIP